MLTYKDFHYYKFRITDSRITRVTVVVSQISGKADLIVFKSQGGNEDEVEIKGNHSII